MLSDDLKDEILSFVDWNWFLVPKFLKEYRRLNLPSNDTLGWDVDYFMHLFTHEPENWRLSAYAERLLNEMIDRNFTAMVDAFAEFIDYNY